MRANRSAKEALKISATSLVISGGLWLFLQWAVATEQAKAPGEKSLGVAALGMFFFPLIGLALATGIVSLLVGVVLALWQRAKASTEHA